MPREYLPVAHGGICDEGPGEESRAGKGIRHRFGGGEPGGDRQPRLPSGPAGTGKTRHRLRRP